MKRKYNVTALILIMMYVASYVSLGRIDLFKNGEYTKNGDVKFFTFDSTMVVDTIDVCGYIIRYGYVTNTPMHDLKKILIHHVYFTPLDSTVKQAPCKFSSSRRYYQVAPKYLKRYVASPTEIPNPPIRNHCFLRRFNGVF